MSFFNLFKRNKEKIIINIFSPIDGKVIPLSEIPDEAYANKIVGDGCGIEATGNEVYCPVDGEVDIFNHVMSIETIQDLEIIFHLGIAKISYSQMMLSSHDINKGIGIKKLKDGECKKGDELLNFNLEEIKEHFYSMKSPFIITSMDIVKSIEIVAKGDVKAGDLLMKVTLK